ncbi:MAG: DUF5107 domain-containing protein, partial [Gemmatimonadetes bacterium]|nr:DUF5107 domain-containing protein [Gemmatimonadota bacterium]
MSRLNELRSQTGALIEDPNFRRYHVPGGPVPMTRPTRRHDPLRVCAWPPFLSALAVALACALTVPLSASSQTRSAARISEETRVIDTYPFSEPDPIPILVSDARLYPYHAFRGYSATSEPREWKVVKLENDLIEVFVLPEAGGKVWGA